MTSRHPPEPECRVPRVELDIVDELDLPHLAEVGAALDRVLSLQPAEVVIDLSECRQIDAAAIGLLLDVQRRLARSGGALTLRDPHPRIRRILDTAHLDQVLRIVASPPPPRSPRGEAAGGPIGPVRGRARVSPVTP
ncbi:STAS domain-containing protein [Micromonospora sp. NPDC050495]|uniref:STAS domain-containing protein n=1 Tax=Micromonospora sp. NPDC050495 TaxID=3154936 RepID=UPI0033C62525